MSAEITAIGNEGFRITSGGMVIYIDAFYSPALWVGSGPCCKSADVKKADLILVTHRHQDHFDEAGVVDVASRTGARVVGPSAVVNRLRSKLANDVLFEVEPELATEGNAFATSIDLRGTRITAFRTFHASDHNSYLVEMKDFRFFHDGDNEDASRIEVAALGRIDALFMATWQGARWVEFIEAVKPARWFLMHLTDEELVQQRAGTFLPDLCDHVPAPDRLVTLGPGESYDLKQ